jgi:hypothetical protein
VVSSTWRRRRRIFFIWFIPPPRRLWRLRREARWDLRMNELLCWRAPPQPDGSAHRPRPRSSLRRGLAPRRPSSSGRPDHDGGKSTTLNEASGGGTRRFRRRRLLPRVQIVGNLPNAKIYYGPVVVVGLLTPLPHRSRREKWRRPKGIYRLCFARREMCLPSFTSQPPAIRTKKAMGERAYPKARPATSCCRRARRIVSGKGEGELVWGSVSTFLSSPFIIRDGSFGRKNH